MDVNEMRRRYREKEAEKQEQQGSSVQLEAIVDNCTNESPCEGCVTIGSNLVAVPSHHTTQNNLPDNYDIKLDFVVGQCTSNIFEEDLGNGFKVSYGKISWKELNKACLELYHTDISGIWRFGNRDLLEVKGVISSIADCVHSQQADEMVSMFVPAGKTVFDISEVNIDRILSLSAKIFSSHPQKWQMHSQGQTSKNMISAPIVAKIPKEQMCFTYDYFRWLIENDAIPGNQEPVNVNRNTNPSTTCNWYEATRKAINLLYKLEKCSFIERDNSLAILEDLKVPVKYAAPWNQILRIWRTFAYELQVNTKELPNPNGVKYSQRPFPIIGSSGIQDLIKEIVRNVN